MRDVAFDVLRALGLTTIFSNPGSTDVPFLAGLPDDLRFVLALHEGAVVAMSCWSTAAMRSLDRLAERSGASGPWPRVDSIEIAALARAQGCEAIRITQHPELLARLDALLPALAERRAPLLLEIVVAADETFDP